MSFSFEKKLFVLVHNSIGRILYVIHLLDVELDLFAYALHVSIVEVNAVAEALNGSLKNWETDFV